MALHKFTPGGCRQNCDTSGCCPDAICAGTVSHTFYTLRVYRDAVLVATYTLTKYDLDFGSGVGCAFRAETAGAGICGLSESWGQLQFSKNGSNTQYSVTVNDTQPGTPGSNSYLSKSGVVIGTAPVNCGQTLSGTFDFVQAPCGVHAWTYEVEPGGTLCTAAASNSCCPCESCTIFRDYFDRTLGTDLGANWTEVSGDWSIESPTRLATDDTGAIAVSSATGSTLGVQATARGAAGDVVRLITGYQDANNYLFGEFTFGASGSISVGSVSGGTETIHETVAHEFPDNGWASLFFCLDGAGVAKAYTSYGTGGNVGANVGAAPGTGTGLGTGGTNSGSIQFDFFLAYVVSASCMQCNLPEDGPSCFTGGVGTISGKCCYLDQPTVEYEIDLGAGGLTDSDCTACTTLAGVFVVRAGSSTYCEWSYTDDAFCASGCGGTPGFWHLRITLSREVSPFCRWVVTVALSDGGNLPCGIYAAVYSDAAALPSAACTGSFTLTKASEATYGGVSPCGGALPATITINSV